MDESKVYSKTLESQTLCQWHLTNCFLSCESEGMHILIRGLTHSPFCRWDWILSKAYCTDSSTLDPNLPSFTPMDSYCDPQATYFSLQLVLLSLGWCHMTAQSSLRLITSSVGITDMGLPHLSTSTLRTPTFLGKVTTFVIWQRLLLYDDDQH